MSPPPSDGKKGSGAARFIGSTAAGVTELFLFHPVDTVAKRLMTNKENVAGVQGFSKVIFRDSFDKPILQRYRSLFPGLGFAAGYKITQRIYKFGGQPIVRDYIKKNHSEIFTNNFSEKNAKVLMQATAGSLVGIGEIFLLPLDVLKIRAQANPQAIAGRGIVDIVKQEGFALYRGAGWTAARNAPGSFALFGCNSLMMEYVFKLENQSDASFLQFAFSSVAGASASIIVSQPLDVIKTRIQARPFDSPESGATVVKNLLKNEGAGALFKGLVPKLSVVGPKLVFSYTIAQYLIAYFEKAL